MNKNHRSEILVGVFVVIGLLMVGGLIYTIASWHNPKKDAYPLYVTFKDAAGIIKGSNVRMGGTVIGFVSNMPELAQGGAGVLMTAHIKNEVKIPMGATFYITMGNLLGDKYIEVKPPEITDPHSKVEYITEGSYVAGSSENKLDKLAGSAVSITDNLEKLLENINKSWPEIEATIKNAREITNNLREASLRLNNSTLSEENLQRVDNILLQFETTAQAFPEIARKVDVTVAEMNSLTKEARGTWSKVDAKVDDLGQTIDLIRPAIGELQPALASFRKLSDNVEGLTADARKDKGVLGLLMYNDKARNDMSIFIQNLRQDGVLKYRDPNQPTAPVDPRPSVSGSRR